MSFLTSSKSTLTTCLWVKDKGEAFSLVCLIEMSNLPGHKSFNENVKIFQHWCTKNRCKKREEFWDYMNCFLLTQYGMKSWLYCFVPKHVGLWNTNNFTEAVFRHISPRVNLTMHLQLTQLIGIINNWEKGSQSKIKLLPYKIQKEKQIISAKAKLLASFVKKTETKNLFGSF